MKKSLKTAICIGVLSVLAVTACGGTQQAAPANDAQSEASEESSAATQESSEAAEAQTEAETAASGTEDSGAEASAEAKEEVIIALGAEPNTGWDPCIGWGVRYEPLMQSKLVVVAADGTVKNDLATEYQVSDDGKEWIFTLRDDAFFSDGEKVTAEDIAFTFETTKTNGASIDLTNMESVEAVDDATVKFTMTKPSFSFVYLAARLPIVPSHAYDGATYSDNPIGSGPYVMTQWDKGQQLILERNEDYYGEKPQIRRLVLLFMDEDTGFAAAQKGDVDVTMTTPALAVQTIDGYSLLNCETINAYGICFPNQPDEGKTTEEGYPIGNAVTSDLAIRKALSYGIDRERLIEDAFYGFAIYASSNLDPLPWFNEETVVKPEETGIDKGIEILEEGGWTDEDGDGVREKDGLKASFRLLYPTTDPTRQAEAMAVAEQAAELGIQIEPAGASWDEIFERFRSDAFVTGSGEYTPTEFIAQYYGPSAGIGYSNNGMFQNATVDSYIEAAEASTSAEEAYENLKKAQWDGTTGASMKGDAPYAWYVRKDNLFFVRDGLSLGNQMLHAHGAAGYQLFNNIAEWSWQ